MRWLGIRQPDGIGLGVQHSRRYNRATVGRHRGVAAPAGEL